MTQEQQQTETETETGTDYEAENALARQPRSNQVARQDFSGTSLAVQGAATDALVAKARADVEARWIIAQRCRRSLDDVRQDLLAECRRPSFARVAMYARPVGKKQDANGQWVNAFAEGLSIRFAEAAARCMGNLQPDVQTIYDDARSRIVRVTVTDYETNVTWSRDLNIAKTVERKQLKKGQRSLGERQNSYGDRVYLVEATDDEVEVKEAARVSKAARTLILRVVPGHIQDECKQVIKAQIAQADAKDPNAAKNRALDAFAQLGIKPSQLIEFLGKPLEQATRDEWVELSQLHQAIRDGETTWADALADAGEMPAQAKPTTPPTQPAAQPQNVAPAPSGEPVKPAESKPAKGKGAAALKADLKGSTPAAKEAASKPAEDPREKEPEWMAGGNTGETPSTSEVYDDAPVEVPCGGCGKAMDIAKGQAKPWLCYVCRQA